MLKNWYWITETFILKKLLTKKTKTNWTTLLINLFTHSVASSPSSCLKQTLKGNSSLYYGYILEAAWWFYTIRRLLINIEYETDPKSTALQWLLPKQTAGKRHPYVFSQCQVCISMLSRMMSFQPILIYYWSIQPDHCRSIVPCQDTPGVKGTYRATVSTP